MSTQQQHNHTAVWLTGASAMHGTLSKLGKWFKHDLGQNSLETPVVTVRK